MISDQQLLIATMLCEISHVLDGDGVDLDSPLQNAYRRALWELDHGRPDLAYNLLAYCLDDQEATRH